MRRPRGPAALVACALAALSLAARLGSPLVAREQAGATARESGEGELRNDAFLPGSEAAEQALRRGDERLEAARAAGGAPEILGEALEAWREALEQSGPRDSAGPAAAAGWLPEDATRTRRSEGAAYAVLARLEALSADERAAWQARFAELSLSELEGARGGPEALADLERRRPGSAAAARAALQLADRALEEGDRLAAATWCERAGRHARLFSPPEPAWAEAVARRAAALERLDTPARAAPPPAWERATKLVALHAFPPFEPGGGLEPGPARGVRPGLCFLDDGRAAVQTRRRISVLAPDLAAIESAFLAQDLLPMRPPGASAAGESPGWPLLPATDGTRLFVVQGRAEAAFDPTQPASPGRDGPNALVAILPPLVAGRGPAERPLPLLEWAVQGAAWIGRDGAERRPELLQGFEQAEIQPGPLLQGSRIYAQVRIGQGQIEAWLLCLEHASGRPLWRLRIAKGAELAPDLGRLQGGPSLRGRASAQPLVAIGTRLFAGTHLGVGALVDALDGRPCWSLLARRRAADEGGWTGAAPIVIGGVVAGAPGAGGAPAGAPLLVWAPADSDRVYWLEAEPRLGPRPLFALPPRAIGGALALLGGERAELVLAARAGLDRAVSALDPIADRRRDSLYLARGEEPSGAGLVSAERVLLATDRSLWLFDRGRELYLLDCPPLLPAALSSERAGGPPAARSSESAAGGGLWARGDRVVLCAPGGTWVFRAE